MITNNIIGLIKRHEGLRLEAYDDTLGVRTIGYGHAIKPDEKLDIIDQNKADLLLLDDLAIAYKDAISFVPKIDSFCEPRQAVLIDLAFNLGHKKLSEFVHFLAAYNSEKWTQAAWELCNSHWFTQVGVRGEENRTIVLTGEWQS